MKEEHTNETVTQTILESMDTIRDLKSIEDIVRKISSPVIDSNPSNLDLIRLLRINEDQLSIEAPLYAGNPYVETFFIAKNIVLSPLLLEYDLRKIFIGKLENNPVYQELKYYIKQHTSNPNFEKKVRSNRKSERKRELSAENYIEAFRQKYARLLVIRLDLYLMNNVDRVNYTRDLLKNMMHFWSQFRRDLNESKEIPNPKGFLGSIEYGHIRGFHFHIMLIFDGSKHQKDILIAKKIGEHWKNKITNGRGDYHNCNAAGPNGYVAYGIGRLDHFDTEKFSILKSVAHYLAKTDYSLQAITDNQRTFFRGIMPKQKSNQGRLRKKLS